MKYIETDTNSCRSEFVPVSCKYPLTKRNVLNLCVNVFSTKVIIGDTIFTSSTGLQFYAVIRTTQRSCRWQCKGSTFISHYFKTLSIIPSPGIEPATSRSGVKRSTNRANPAVKQVVHTRRAAVGLQGLVYLFTLHQRVSQEPYPICHDSLLRSACRSICNFAPLQKLHRNHRSFICVNRSQGAQKLSGIV